MKKFILGSLLMAALFIPSLHIHAGGGDAALGAVGGLAIGTMLGSSMSRGSGSSRRAEREASEAKMQTQQLRNEQQLRRDMTMRGKMDTSTMMLIILVVFLFLSIIGLGIFVLKKR